jgi:hypothetical protein
MAESAVPKLPDELLLQVVQYLSCDVARLIQKEAF